MAKINVKKETRKTTNKAGGETYKISDKEAFVQMLMTCLWNEPKFYGDTSNDMVEKAILICKHDPEFVAKAAVYARERMNLRTAPTVIAAIVAMYGQPFARKTINRVILRADQIKEIIAYLNSVNDKLVKSLSQFKLGIADRLLYFANDEYRLAKYNGRTGAVSLKDAVLISHPKPTTLKQALTLKRLLDDTLETPETWEAKSSEAKLDGPGWDALWKSGNLGYMAALRNLRNMYQANASCLKDVCAMLANPSRVAMSKQFPFRFLSAYEEMSKVGAPSYILDALHDALEASCGNLQFEGVTFCAADNSGSMSSYVSSKTRRSCADIANLLQAMLSRKNTGNIASVFGETFKVVPTSTKSSIFDLASKFERTDVGHSTNGYLVVKHLLDKNISVDRVIILTDMQLWNSGYTSSETIQGLANKYWKQVNPNTWFHIINLNGYGDGRVLIGKNVSELNGWSEKLLELIPKIEEGGTNMLNEIESIEL